MDMGSMGSKVAKNPGVLITLAVAIIILTSFLTPVYPLVISGFASLSTLGNFTFSSLFDSTSGVVVVIMSAIVLAAALGVLGFKIFGGSKR